MIPPKISRDEYKRRYADRVTEVTGMDRKEAELLFDDGDSYENYEAGNCSMEPEESADEEMSYWDSDEDPD
jgi:hypothetical protein